jgi:DNA repair protein RadC
LRRSGELIGIELLDHLVVGDKQIVSLRERAWPEDQRCNGGV